LRSAGKLSRTIYLAADDIATVRAHPIVRKAASLLSEVKAIATFGAHLSDTRFDMTTKISLEKGIDVQSYQDSITSPYAPGSTNGISVGNMLFDDMVPSYALEVPEIDFHFVGRVKAVSADNLNFPGVLPYKETVPLVRFADFGLLPYRLAPDMSYLVTSSLKLAQFKLCGLPVVGPAYLPVNQDWYFAYTPSEEAFREAVKKAIEFGKRSFNADPSVRDFRDNWSQVAAYL
jgi:2-beta-glucuronyltransferase